MTATHLPANREAVTPEPDLWLDLYECLTNIKAPGTFALSESLPDAPNPGIFLKNGAGGIGLPLSDRDAAAIVAASHRAPFGKGEETIVDESVRKTWEISADEFELQNPAWPPFLDSIVKKVSAGLGVNADGKGVSAELYKMLLYEEGAMFMAHQDSEKALRMFGTLVIALPSKHEGGEVVVTHAGQTRTLKSSPTSHFGNSYLTWFSDVTHEVKPVRSGRRLVLTYNLIHTTLGSRELGASVNKALVKLRVLFSYWKKNIEDTTSSLGFLLEHQYTDESLRYDSLKGHDLQVAAHLRPICEEFGYCLYLASVSREVFGAVENEDGDSYGHTQDDLFDEDVTLSLPRVVDLDGSLIVENVEFDEENIIQADAFQSMTPDDEDCSGFTGNEGVSTTLFYHKTALIIVPKSERMNFLLGPLDATDFDQKVTAVCNVIVKELTENGNDEYALVDFNRVCAIVESRLERRRLRKIELIPFPDQMALDVLKTALKLEQKDNFQRLLLPILNTYSTSGIASDLYFSIGAGLLRLRLVNSGLVDHINAKSSLSEIDTAVKAISAGLEKEASTKPDEALAIQGWLRRHLPLAISSKDLVSVEDADSLIKYSDNLPKADLFNLILPAVKRNSHHMSFCLAYMSKICVTEGPQRPKWSERRSDTDGSELIKEPLPQNVVSAIFKDVIEDLVGSFDMRKLFKKDIDMTGKRVVTNSGQAIAPSQHLETTSTIDENIKNLASVLCSCSRLSLPSQLDRLINNIISNASNGPSEHFDTIYLPLLKHLFPLLMSASSGNKPCFENPAFQRLYQQVLISYIVEFVKLEPTAPQHWGSPPIKCTERNWQNRSEIITCKHCTLLNAFLIDRNQQVWKYKEGVGNRAHLGQVLHGYDVETSTTTDKGSRQTLTVTKTNGRFQREHKEWEQRRHQAQEVIRELLKEAAAPLLGPHLDAVIGVDIKVIMIAARQLPSSNALTPTSDAGNRTLPPITKRKAPQEVIILDN